jgi:hypothetical protein
MLSAESLKAIADLSESVANAVAQSVCIEIWHGFNYGSIKIASSDKGVFGRLKEDLGWSYSATEHVIHHRFQNAETAMAVAKIIEADLKGKGIDVCTKLGNTR